MKKKWCIIASLFLLSGCFFSPDQIPQEKITSINIIDRNGMSETINAKERLTAFERTDFLSPQPYQKVLRIYERQQNGDVPACITSYHPNGQIKQFLEVVNNRACGHYREWYANGTLKLEAIVIGGMGDINTLAEQSWLFDKTNRAWDEDGNLIAEITYDKGELQGDALYYHPNGQVWKICPYHKNQLHGTAKIFLEDGQLLQLTTYKEGIREGMAIRYWDPSRIAYREVYQNGFLMEGSYTNFEGKVVSKIERGNGFRAVFGKRDLEELHQYQKGVQAGCVKVYDGKGFLSSIYSVKDGEKNGEEIVYYPGTTQPKLMVTWHEGLLQGPAKTWYENGHLESQREMNGNQKHGLYTAWYPNGALMLVEEYDGDRLIKGEYYRLGEKTAVSQIEKGKGIATLFNPEGNFSKKIIYQDGKPAE